MTLSYTHHTRQNSWTSGNADAETSTWQHTTLIREDMHAPGGIRTHISSRRVAAGPAYAATGIGLSFYNAMYFIN
jgi:hypothetical protein